MRIVKFLGAIFVIWAVIVFVPLPIGTASTLDAKGNQPKKLIPVTRTRYLVPRKFAWAGWPFNSQFGFYPDPDFDISESTSIASPEDPNGPRLTAQSMFVNGSSIDFGGVTERFIALEDKDSVTEHPYPIGGPVPRSSLPRGKYGARSSMYAIAAWETYILLYVPLYSDHGRDLHFSDDQAFLRVPRSPDGSEIEIIPKFEAQAWENVMHEIHEAPVLELEKLCKIRSKNAIALLNKLGVQPCVE